MNRDLPARGETERATGLRFARAAGRGVVLRYYVRGAAAFRYTCAHGYTWNGGEPAPCSHGCGKARTVDEDEDDEPEHGYGAGSSYRTPAPRWITPDAERRALRMLEPMRRYRAPAPSGNGNGNGSGPLVHRCGECQRRINGHDLGR